MIDLVIAGNGTKTTLSLSQEVVEILIGGIYADIEDLYKGFKHEILESSREQRRATINTLSVLTGTLKEQLNATKF